MSSPGAALHRSQHPANPGENASRFPQLVLPNAYDAPTVPAERAGHDTVANLIVRQLFLPEGAVARRHVGMFWTAVPEATIHENSDALPPESEVRSADKGCVTTPASDAFGAEQPGE
jgi:hypothetical protein